MKYSDLFFIDEVRHTLRRGYAYCLELVVISMIYAGIKKGWFDNARFSGFSVSGWQYGRLPGRTSAFFLLNASCLNSATSSEPLHFFWNSHAAA
jgi:hypothetical protein